MLHELSSHSPRLLDIFHFYYTSKSVTCKEILEQCTVRHGIKITLDKLLDKSLYRWYTIFYSSKIQDYCLTWFYSNRLSWKRLDFNNRFMLYPRCYCIWAKSTWPPNQILFGEVYHDFGLNEQARKSIRRSAKQGCLPRTGLGRTAICGEGS